jgi:hypothetical protein
MPKSETGKGLNHCLYHEKYLKVFLDDERISLDNNDAEQEIRGFSTGKAN